MNEVIKCLKERRSIRKYKKDAIPQDILDQILEAGTYAASGKNKQSSVIVVVDNPEIISKLSKINGEIFGVPGDPFYGAPLLVIVFANKNIRTHICDGSLVIGNIMHAAFSLGVDSCWIHRAKETFETEYGQELMAKWGLGEEYVGVGNCILGYRDEELPPARPRKENYIIYDNEK